ncbi:MAG: SusC/RagA family TonB-linked outer membrane protein [Hymenobacter sp.]|nr:MAG: SusC/RagA family TonB-linked outer membrane protein [Hymenobacter sp.]
MARFLHPHLPLAGATPTRLAAALLVGGTLLGAASASAAPAAKLVTPAGINVAFTGLVKDTKGNPLPGATIIIRGTKSGTTSAADGTFRFNLPTGNEVLIISSVGFKTQEIEVKGRATLEVRLEDDNASLDEVVVVGYGTQTKAHLTGAVASVDMNNIQNLPVGSLSSTIQGQLPGVGVSGGTGRPGEPGLITVRNPIILSKDGGTTQPLYVIDNVVRTMMNGLQQATYLNDLNIGAGKALTDASIYTPDELAYFADHNTDWLRMAWKPALLTRHALNMSGGSDRVTYFAGVTYNYQNANFEGNNANKWTYRASTNVKVARGLSADLSLSGSLFYKHNYYLKQGGENVENDMRSLLYASQFNPPYVDGLPILTSTAMANTVEATNFFAAQATGNYSDSRYTGLNLTGSVSYDVPWVKGLQARVLFSKTMDNTFGKQFGTFYNTYRFDMLGDHKHIYGGKVLGVTAIKNGDIVRIVPQYYDSYQLNGYLNYNNKFGKHAISAIAFFEQSETFTDQVQGYQEGVIVGGLDNMNFATGTQTAAEAQTEFGTLSYAGRINYAYADKYLLEFAVRRDASTNFAPNYRWGNFPSLSAGWVMSEEPFFRNNVPFVNFLKLRGSIGYLGGDATRAYNWLTSYGIQLGKGAVFGGNGDRPLVITPNNAMANPRARWDDNIKYNGGIDAQFFNGRVSFTLDAFYDHRYNMLTSITSAVPLLVGATLPSENYASVDGFGYEVSLGYNNRITKDLGFRLNTFFTWNDNKQIIVDVEKGKLNTYLDPTNQSTDQGVFGYHYAGFFRTQADIDAFYQANPGYDKTYTIGGKKPAPGMLYYNDVRGPKQADGTYAAPDGLITEADQDYLTPKSGNHYSIGFNPSITYKSLTFSATMGLSYGGQATVEGNARAAATATINRPEFWADHWTPENTNASMPSPYYTSSAGGGVNAYTSEFWFRSSFSAGMRNANISYAFPAAITSRLHMSNLNVFFVAVNPLNFYNPYSYKTYSGAFDSYPTLRSLSLGLNVSL